MNQCRTLVAAAVSIAAAMIAAPAAQAGQAVSLEELLERVQAGRTRDAQENAERIRRFQADRANQARLVEEAKAERARAEQLSAELDATFEQNDVLLLEKEQELQEALGSLKELFGVLQQAAGDAQGAFQDSATQIQFGDRRQFLVELDQKMGQGTRLASIEEIEQLWYELQREMVESGKVAQFQASVSSPQGETATRRVTRVGLFNVVSDGKYLNYNPETTRLVELARQPQGRYVSKIEPLENATSGLHPVGIDPSRGQLLAQLVKEPSLPERIDQGGEVGYTIIGLGIVALIVAIWRLVVLTLTSAQVAGQMRNPDSPGNNPLGRVLQVYADNKSTDLETLELKLGEAILKETPKLNRMLMFLKIVAVVAPLMGLLGTVTGMIITFQKITLFGTGDPTIMAGGISQALMTTVLGLCVAIPTVFLHALVSGRAKSVSQVLQEQAAGIVARQAEQSQSQRAAA